MAILEYLLGHEPDNQNNAHWESLGSVPSVSQCSSPPLSDIIYRGLDGVWTSCVSPIAPGPGLCLLSTHNGQTRINVRSFSQQSAPSDMNHIPVAWPPSSLYRVWKIKWEAVCHPVHVAWGINRFVIEHILVYLCGEFELSATNLCDHFLWNAEPDYWR